MIKSVEATGKTIDDAIENAVAMLGVDRYEADVAIEIIDRPKSGFLGIGGTPAKVRASYDDGVEEVVEPKPKPVQTRAKPKEERVPKVATPAAATASVAPEREAPRQERQPRPRVEREPHREAPRLEVMTDNGVAKAASAVEFLNGLMSRMGTAATPSFGELEDGTIDIQLEGENMGVLIGRRGETLNAIQHITNFVVNKGAENRTRIVVDIEDYRKKREDSLKKLALRTAGKVVKIRRNVTLEPMNAYERHVIHTALQDWRDVSTFSTGSEPRRAVVISYTPGGRRNDGGEGGGERRSRPSRREGYGNRERTERSDRVPRTHRDDAPAEPRTETKPLDAKEFW